jgi:hypothetical protein
MNAIATIYSMKVNSYTLSDTGTLYMIFKDRDSFGVHAIEPNGELITYRADSLPKTRRILVHLIARDTKENERTTSGTAVKSVANL